MRDIVSPLDGFRSPFGQRFRDAYAVLGARPALVFDFANEYYRTGGTQTTFDSAMTHSRSGNATMVDSDGLLKWAPHNLVTYSEQFDNAVWTKSGVTTTANATTAPDGTATAEKVVVDGSSGFHRLNVTAQNLPATPHTLSAYFKAGEYTNAGLGLFNGSTFGARAIFDLSNGTVSVTDGAATISDVGNGWYRCSITGAASATTTPYLYVNSLFTYTGDGTSGIYIWGAHAYRSDLGGMVNNPNRGDSYVPTTSAAVYMPRRGHHVYNGASWVNEGLLVESEARTNLADYSNDASNWSIVGTDSFTLTANAETGSDGTLSLTKVEVTDTTNEVHQFYSNIGTDNPSTGLTLSVDLKYGTQQYVMLRHFIQTNDWIAIVFDIQNGVVTQESAGTGTSSITGSGVIDLGNGIYRCWVSYIDSLNTASVGIPTVDSVSSATPTLASNGTESYAGVGGEYFYAGNFQLEAGSTPSSYIPTSGATVTRAADTLTVPSANLPWPTVNVIGPELVTNGTFDTDTDWTKGTGWSISGGVAVHSGGSSGGITQTVSAPTGKVYQFTLDISGWNGSGVIQVQLYGGGGSDSFQVSANGSYTRFITTTLNRTTFGVFTASGWDGTIDNISVREIDPLAVSIQMEGRATGDTLTTTRWYLDANNYITQEINTSDFTFEQANAGTVDAVTGGSFTSGVNTSFNFASTHASTLVAAAVGGTALTDNTTPTALADLSSTDMALAYSGGPMILKTVRMWPANITEAGREEASA